MTRSDRQSTLEEDAPPNQDSDEGTMAELRSLLLGPAEAQLAEVHTRLTDPERQLEEVSRVLPDAIAVRARQDDDLTTVLGPTVSAALEHSVRKDPKPLADAIFPIMGPAIRKSIAAALSGMIQSLNQTLSYSLSAQGLKWRWEALRTGKSFSEVVLLHTLRYRVEEVFLIHRETGLLLRHVSAGGSVMQDADMVSGMLTAIQDFVKDSFTGGQGDQMRTLDFVDLDVWIEQGPLAILAGAVRGTAPEDLRVVFQEVLERIHLQFGADLKDFAGDAAVFEGTEPLLQECLQSALQQQDTSAQRKITPFRIIMAVILLAVLVFGFFWIRDRRRWNAYLERLRSEPGIVVTDQGTQGGKYFVSGLRDPLARDSKVVMQGTGVAEDSVVERWQPFQALTPDLVLARAKKTLDPPPTVTLAVHDTTLEATGFAPHEWVVETRRIARLLPGVNQFDEGKLFDTQRIENPLLMFEFDQTELKPNQEEKLQQLISDIGRVQQLAGDKQAHLEIMGRTDGSGSEVRNTSLSQGRADAVAELLRKNLPSANKLKISTVGSKDKVREELTEADRAMNRSVTVKVILSDAH